MKRISLALLVTTCSILSVFSQIMLVTREPFGGSKRTWVGEQIGVVKIDISWAGNSQPKISMEYDPVFQARSFIKTKIKTTTNSIRYDH